VIEPFPLNPSQPIENPTPPVVPALTGTLTIISARTTNIKIRNERCLIVLPPLVVLISIMNTFL